MQGMYWIYREDTVFMGSWHTYHKECHLCMVSIGYGEDTDHGHGMIQDPG